MCFRRAAQEPSATTQMLFDTLKKDTASIMISLKNGETHHDSDTMVSSADSMRAALPTVRGSSWITGRRGQRWRNRAATAAFNTWVEILEVRITDDVVIMTFIMEGERTCALRKGCKGGCIDRLRVEDK